MSEIKDVAKDALSAGLKSLYRALRGHTEGVPIKDLPQDCRATATLASALQAGHIEVGRRDHCELIVKGSVKVRKDRQGKIEFDENLRPVVDKEIERRADGAMSWTNLARPGFKSLGEVLEEDATMPDDLRLRARLTTLGQAAV